MESNNIYDPLSQPQQGVSSNEVIQALQFNDFSSLGIEVDGFSDNPLLKISQPIFLHIIGIQRLPQPKNIIEYRGTLKQLIIMIAEKCRALGYTSSVTDKLCCLHCIVLDEFILHSDWGQKGGWENRTMLSQLFGLRNGGDLFFKIMGLAGKQSDRMHDFLEVTYLYLKMGFQGCYRDRVPKELYPIMQKLQHILKKKDESLFPEPLCITTPLQNTSNKLPRGGLNLLPLYITLLLSLGFAQMMFSYWNRQSDALRAMPFKDLASISYRAAPSQQDITFRGSVKVTPHSENRVLHTAHAKKILQRSESHLIASDQTGDKYWVQLGSFRNRANAEEMIQQHTTSNKRLHIAINGDYFVVYIAAQSQEDALKIQKSWVKQYYEESIIMHRSQFQP